MRLPCGVPQRIIEKRRPWWIHSPGDIQGAAHTQGRNASRFDVPGNQSDGLMTHRSYRDE